VEELVVGGLEQRDRARGAHTRAGAGERGDADGACDGKGKQGDEGDAPRSFAA